MDKRILTLGCICAVAILIGVSFTSVVGYSNTRTKMLESPLYNVRTNRAIDNGKDVTTCDYIGKEKPFSIPLLILDNKIALIKQFIGEIKKLDDKSLKELKELVNQLNIINEGNDDLLYTKAASYGDCCTWQYPGECPIPTISEPCTHSPVLCKIFGYMFGLGLIITAVVGIPAFIIWFVLGVTEYNACFPSLILLPRCIFPDFTQQEDCLPSYILPRCI